MRIRKRSKRTSILKDYMDKAYDLLMKRRNVDVTFYVRKNCFLAIAGHFLRKNEREKSVKMVMNVCQFAWDQMIVFEIFLFVRINSYWNGNKNERLNELSVCAVGGWTWSWINFRQKGDKQNTNKFTHHFVFIHKTLLFFLHEMTSCPLMSWKNNNTNSSDIYLKFESLYFWSIH